MPCVNHADAVDQLVTCSRCGKSFCGDCVVELRGRTYCASCKGEQVRDIQSGADASALELASVGRRFCALFIDNFILTVIVQVLIAVIGSALGPDVALPLIILLMFVPWLLYEGLMLQTRGQTLGKMALKIKVVTPEGSDISTGQAWGRAAVRSLLSLVAIIDCLPALFNKQKKCIHDMAAGTRVVNWRP